jgi:hypothetical protein
MIVGSIFGRLLWPLEQENWVSLPPILVSVKLPTKTIKTPQQEKTKDTQVQQERLERTEGAPMQPHR